jgi:phage terminase Nu1 subunit (DNA packaging protein)
MARPLSENTVLLKKIATKSGLTVGHLRDLKRSGLPVHDVDAALAWLSNRPDPATASDGPDDSSPAELRRQRIMLLAVQRTKAELALEIEKGRYIEREQVAEYLLQIGSSLASFLKRYQTEMVQVTNSLPLPQALDAAKRKSDELRELWANGESEFWQSHPTE